jgi:hypothetical protein
VIASVQGEHFGAGFGGLEMVTRVGDKPCEDLEQWSYFVRRLTRRETTNRIPPGGSIQGECES